MTSERKRSINMVNIINEIFFFWIFRQLECQKLVAKYTQLAILLSIFDSSGLLPIAYISVED